MILNQGLIKLVGSAPLGCVRGDQLIIPRLQGGVGTDTQYLLSTCYRRFTEHLLSARHSESILPTSAHKILLLPLWPYTGSSTDKETRSVRSGQVPYVPHC